MPTIEDYAQRPRPERLDRIARTPDELADAVRGVADAVLSRRPAPKSWAATEVVCHLRDNEEWFLDRMKLIDRKSTRLNSSHVRISYAVFCLKKKKAITRAIYASEAKRRRVGRGCRITAVISESV